MQELKFKITLVLSILFCSLLSSPAKAITFGQEVLSASSEYSYVVSIWHTESPQTAPSFTCTGTLIEPTVVLTAAHCLLDDRGAPRKGAFFVKYGNNLLQEGSLREVTANWHSPQYSNSKGVGDVGLLRLSYPALGVQVLPLINSTQIKKVLANKKTKFEAVGWGIDQNRNMATYLKRVNVKDESIFIRKAVKWWRPAIWLAAGKYDSKQKVFGGVCSGDSGGPIFAITNGQRVQVGITMATFAEDCELLAPSIFTRLDYYFTHIQQNLRTLENNQIVQNKAFPSLIEEPRISGTPAAGSTITCDKGRWSDNTTDVTITWSEYGRTYNSSSLILSETYSSRTFQCTVIGKNSNGELKRVLTIVQPPTPVKPSTPYPSISGISSYSNTTVGTIAQCSATSYSSDAVMSYQWGYGTSSYVSSLSNPLGSGSTLTISQSILDAVKGKYLICQATATNSAGSSTGYTTQSVTGVSATPTPTPTPTTSTNRPTDPNVSVTGIVRSGLRVGDIATCNTRALEIGESITSGWWYRWSGNAGSDRYLGSSKSITFTADTINSLPSLSRTGDVLQQIFCDVVIRNSVGSTNGTSSAYFFGLYVAPTPTPTPSATPTPTPSATPTPTPSATPTPTPSATPTPTPSATPTPTPTPTPSSVSTTSGRVCTKDTSCTPFRNGTTAPIVDVNGVQIPSGSYVRGTKVNISVRAQASAGTTISVVRVIAQPFCGDGDINLTLSSGTNSDGTYSGTVDTSNCRRAGNIILWPVGQTYLAMYVYGGNGATSFIAGEFNITD